MGARHVWGRSVKYLGLTAGVSFARLTPLPLLLISRTPSRTVSFPSCKFSETPATQATGEVNKQPLICRSPLSEIAQHFRLVRLRSRFVHRSTYLTFSFFQDVP